MMICEVCKKNPASIHITKIINGKKQETNMCEECARNAEGLNLGMSTEFGGNFSFQNVLSGLMDYIGQPSVNSRNTELVCEKCGTTYSEFKKTGLLGCSECYENLKSALIPVVKRVQGNTEHAGKIPKKMGKEILEKKRLLKLKEELQKSIAAEEYEKAAQIRDQIRELQKGE